MKHYEIRVFNKVGRTSLIYHQIHLGDRAAIVAAMEIAGDRAFDVWRGMDCIFAGQVLPDQTVQ